MSNLIATRIADFLKTIPPFDVLEMASLQQMARKAVVLYYPQGATILPAGEVVGNEVFVVHEGAVDVHWENRGAQELIAICGEGDSFVLQKRDFPDTVVAHARTREDTLIYRIPLAGFEDTLKAHPDFFKMVQGYPLPNTSIRDIHAIIDLSVSTDQMVHISGRHLVCGDQCQTIRAAAMEMAKYDAGSFLVTDDRRHPIGIVTDKDLRYKVLAGAYTSDDTVDKIMSMPVVTAAPDASWSGIQLLMFKRRIRHVCLTQDGTKDSPAVGMISMSDVMLAQSSSPALLIQAIEKADTATRLAVFASQTTTALSGYLDLQIDMEYTTAIFTELYDAITQRALELSLAALAAEGVQAPKSSFCWLALGSLGRAEQVLRTDQDNALIFELLPEEESWAPAYFLNLAKRVNAVLAQCGFEPCPAGMMAENPANCRSLEAWKQQCTDWTEKPIPEAIRNSTVYFDFRAIYGNEALAVQLATHIETVTKEQELFWGYLAKDALQNPPPLTFFRNLVVESGGAHQNEFDLKARVLVPIADAARVLALHRGYIARANTVQRLRYLAATEPENLDIFQLAAEAYVFLLQFRAMQGLRHGDSGRYCRLAEMRKMEQIQLRAVFAPLRALQTIVRVRFQTAFLGG